MNRRDPYEILGVGRDADDAAIKKAYRSLAMKYHPDRNAGDACAAEKFREANDAHAILSDSEKRAAYDRFGYGAFDQATGGAHADGFDFDDIFGHVFGGMFSSGGRQSRSGNNVRYAIEISLEEAYAGKETRIKIPSSEQCSACDGSGAASADGVMTCEVCAGQGTVQVRQGFFTISETCRSCRGSGRIIIDRCRACSGAGRVQRNRAVNVKIPAGIGDGVRIRMSGGGEPGPHGGPPGDLYIDVGVRAHPIFMRNESTIYCSVPVAMTKAALGGQVEIPTIDGSSVKLEIPAGTQSGNKFRFAGKGMPVVHKRRRGDMIVEVLVETPVELTAEQRDLLLEFEIAGRSDSNNPESEGFFARVRDFMHGLRH